MGIIVKVLALFRIKKRSLTGEIKLLLLFKNVSCKTFFYCIKIKLIFNHFLIIYILSYKNIFTSLLIFIMYDFVLI